MAEEKSEPKNEKPVPASGTKAEKPARAPKEGGAAKGPKKTAEGAPSAGSGQAADAPAGEPVAKAKETA